MKESQMQVTVTETMYMTKKPDIFNQIRSKKDAIKNIKSKHTQKVRQSINQIQQLEFNNERVRASTLFEKHQATQAIQVNEMKIKNTILEDLKNIGVSDSDKMIYEKKFKNFLNHREQYERLARERIEKIKKLRKQKEQGNSLINQQDLNINKDQLFNDRNYENQFQNAIHMFAAYQQISTGKRQKKDTQLYHAEKIQYLFRREEFDYIILLEQHVDERNRENELPTLITAVKKESVLNYLFDEPIVMMLYSINPYLLGDELTEFQTEIKGEMTFEEFSKFLLLDRSPTYFEYSQQNLQQAKKLGRGIKCQSIIAKWIEDEDTYEWLIEIFKEIDMLGQNKAQKQILAKKIRKEAEKKLILNKEIIQIININKFLTLDRLLYELEYSLKDSEKITLEEFEGFLRNYKRLQTPEKDKLIKKLILSGKYDPSYIFILNSEALEIIKEVFSSIEKFAEYFVLKEKFVGKLVKHPKFNKIRTYEVRSETNRFVKKQTVEETLVRFLNEAQTYVDIEEVLEFFTNRGRPLKVEHMIYLANLQMQLERIEQEQRRKQEKKLSQGDYSTSSDDQQFQRSLREKKIQRKKDKLKAIRQSENFEEGKKFIITVPVPFSFSKGEKKLSIREKKLAETLYEKRRLQDESMKPIKPKQVPIHVKENLFEKIMKDQQRQRRQRLQRFRIESIENMYPVSEHLFKKKQKQSKNNVPKHQKFIARPLPWYCEVNLMERIQKEKDERRERILEEVINKHSEYDMPEKVKQMIQRQQKAKENKEKLRSMSKTTADVECSFIPKISQYVPDFKMMHQHLQIELQSKKQEKKPIKIEPFSFENRPTRSRTALQPQIHGQMKKSKQQYNPPNQQVNIPITKKYEALVNLRHYQSKEKQIKQQEEKKAEAIRKMRQQKFAPYVREVLRNSQCDPAKSRMIVEEKIKQFKRQERRKKAQYEQEMLKIYTKVFSRPLLIESTGSQGLKEQTHHHQSRNREDRQRQKNIEQNNQMQNDAEDYEVNYKPEQQYSKRYNPQNEELRRKAIEHPPRNYLMQQPNDQQGDQEYDYEGEYLSENGRYTN